MTNPNEQEIDDLGLDDLDFDDLEDLLFEEEFDEFLESVPLKKKETPRISVHLINQQILLSLRTDQLNMLGQTFRPIFCGKLTHVTSSHITLNPVIIKFPNAPFHQHSTPLSFPLNNIAAYLPFDCEKQIPVS